MWFIFAISAAFLTALNFALVKKFLKDTNQFILAFASSAVVAAILFAGSAAKGFPKITVGFYFPVLATVLLNVFIIYLNYKALGISDLSLVAPMASFTPVFLIFTSFVFLGEAPSAIGAAGIFLIVAGSYILNVQKGANGFFDPIKNIFENKGVFLMLVSAFLASVSVNFDKMVVQNSDPVFGSAVVYLLLALSFFAIAKLKKYDVGVAMKNNYFKFFILGLVIASVVLFINFAYTIQIISYVISLKRLSVLFTVLLGALIFKEKNIPVRIFGALVMLAGSVIIIFS